MRRPERTKTSRSHREKLCEFAMEGEGLRGNGVWLEGYSLHEKWRELMLCFVCGWTRLWWCNRFFGLWA